MLGRKSHHVRRTKRLSIESLEARLALAARPIITEFMADNNHTLPDGYGGSSDWIELFNAGDEALDLAGWHLTDSADNLNKWTFPSVVLASGEYLVVFASGTGTPDPLGNLHASFALAANGEYVALVEPDGVTVASEFGPVGTNYPKQFEDVSYGLSAEVATTSFVGPAAAARVLVPTVGDNVLIGNAWTTATFVEGAAGESAWTGGANGVGFSTTLDNGPLIGTDVETAMHGQNASAYVRLPFDVPSADVLDDVDTLTLGMDYDDGFVAYLNGTEVARRNALASTAWNSAATEDAGATHVDFANFLSTTGLTLNGSADQFGDRLRLTPSVDNLAGSAFLSEKVVLSDDLTFSTQFAFEIANPDDHPGDADGPGADGFTFVVHNDPRGASAIGAAGGALGATTIAPALIVEFDTYFGGSWDVASNNPNHIGIDTSTAATSIAQTGQLAKWLGAGTHHVWIDYAGATDTVRVYLSQTTTKPAAPVLSTVIDLNALFGGANELTFGFTAGTGGASEEHDILSWRLDAPASTTDDPPPPPPGATNLNYPTFASTADFRFNGSAAQSTDRIRLTPTLTSQAGSAFRNAPVVLPDDYSFSTNFAFQISGSGPSTISDPDGIGADGFTFAMHRDARGSAALGSLGCGLGLTNCNNTQNIQPFVAIEFDTWHTGAFDLPANNGTNGNHLAIDASTSTQSLYQSGPLPRFNNGATQYAWIDYDGATDTMRIFLNATANVKPATPSLTGTIDLAALFGGATEVYLGFTAGTGGAYGNHDILAWQFTADAPTVPPPPTGPQGFASEQIDISALRHLLTTGTNVLAVHGMNVSADNSDFLILPTLLGSSAGDYANGTPRFFLQPTPGGPNGVGQQDLGPIVADVSHSLERPADNEDLIITAAISPTNGPVDDATLHYRVMYGIESVVAMVDDGSGADALAGDGIYTATIPHAAFAPGEMVRYYVTSSDTVGNASRAPLFEDREGEDQSAQYFGTVVADPATSSGLPILEWFLAPGTQSAAETDAGTRASVYFNGEFYDNIFVRRRGDASSSGYPKANLKFKFNEGESFRYRDEERRVSEFNLNATWSDKSYIRRVLAWETYRDAGSPYSLSFPMRVEQNGAFFSVAIFIEQPDDEYFKRQDLPEGGALYKMRSQLEAVGGGTSKDTRQDEDFSDLQALVNGISPSNANRGAYVFDNVDIPRMLDYLAASVIMHENDHMSKNYYMYRDRPVSEGGTGEWFMLPWDKDLTYGKNWEPTAGGVLNDLVWADNDQIPGKSAVVKPSHPLFGDSAHQKNDLLWNRLFDAIYKDPTLREMYLRRLRTLMDEILQPPCESSCDEPKLEARIDELVALMSPDVVLDRAKWGNPYGANYDFVTATNIIKNDYLVRRRSHLYVTHSIHNTTGAGTTDVAGIPDEQIGNPTILFGSIDVNPASGNQDEEYIELVNPNATAVDISGWRIAGGVGHTFRAGTIIPANGKLYVSPDAGAFRARASGPAAGQRLLVQGSYAGHLSNFGETLELIAADDSTVDSTSTPSMPSPAQQFLRITEIMYHPGAPTLAELAAGFGDGDLFEFIELHNTSATTAIDLTGVHFSQGISYAFGASTLPPLGYAVLVSNEAAFAMRYGPSVAVVGVFTGNLSNGGESLKLDDATGSTIHQFAFDDDGVGWYPSTDALGDSLAIRNPTAPLASWNDPAYW
ncbi:MAG: lamin tail domain-containing protein, partial [Pirellulales bacterium]